jgi:cupin fold WbuC family metalloprotein
VSLVFWDRSSVEEVKKLALASEKKYARLCAHPHVDDRMQEMLIAVHSDARVRWHSHEYDESLAFIDGAGMIATQSASDDLFGIALDASHFFVRVPAGMFHRPIVSGEWLVFIENAPGPWRTENTRWREW